MVHSQELTSSPGATVAADGAPARPDRDGLIRDLWLGGHAVRTSADRFGHADGSSDGRRVRSLGLGARGPAGAAEPRAPGEVDDFEERDPSEPFWEPAPIRLADLNGWMERTAALLALLDRRLAGEEAV